MKTLKAQYIADVQSLSDEALRTALADLEPHAIDNVNWNEFPYAPSVTFRIAYSEKAIALMFEVNEAHVKATALENNGPVWEDSCVEFFVKTPDGKQYTNFEMNCIGTMLAARRSSRHDPSHYSDEKIAQVRRVTSLPHAAVDFKGENQSWWAVEVIPFDLMGYENKPESISANLYKCGDKCEQAHFLSWSPIGLPSPDFHCPDFFGTIEL